jgi:predicted transport protein
VAEAPAARAAGAVTWTCPRCRRAFRQENQRHACGTGDRAEVLRGRSDALVHLYQALEQYLQALGPIEVVARERYVLFRSTRIFTDLTVMVAALRVVVHLRREVRDPLFIKAVHDRGRVSLVARVETEDQLRALEPYLREAYLLSIAPSDHR